MSGESQKPADGRRRGAIMRSLREHAQKKPGRKRCKCPRCEDNRSLLRDLAAWARGLSKLSLIAGGLTRGAIMRREINEATAHALRPLADAAQTLLRLLRGEHLHGDHEKTMHDLLLIRDVLDILKKDPKWKTRFKLAKKQPAIS